MHLLLLFFFFGGGGGAVVGNGSSPTFVTACLCRPASTPTLHRERANQGQLVGMLLQCKSLHPSPQLALHGASPTAGEDGHPNGSTPGTSRKGQDRLQIRHRARKRHCDRQDTPLLWLRKSPFQLTRRGRDSSGSWCTNSSAIGLVLPQQSKLQSKNKKKRGGSQKMCPLCQRGGGKAPAVPCM